MKAKRWTIPVDATTWNEILAAGAKLKVAKDTLERLAAGR